MKRQDEDDGVPYQLRERLKNFVLAHRQCECGSELMMRVNAEGHKQYYCPRFGRFFWPGGNCKDGSLFAAPI